MKFEVISVLFLFLITLVSAGFFEKTMNIVSSLSNTVVGSPMTIQNMTNERCNYSYESNIHFNDQYIRNFKKQEVESTAVNIIPIEVTFLH